MAKLVGCVVEDLACEMVVLEGARAIVEVILPIVRVCPPRLSASLALVNAVETREMGGDGIGGSLDEVAGVM